MSLAAADDARLWAEGKSREEITAEADRLEAAPEWRGVEFDDHRMRHKRQTRVRTLREIAAAMSAAEAEALDCGPTLPLAVELALVAFGRNPSPEHERALRLAIAALSTPRPGA